MNLEEKRRETEWYDDAGIITILLTVLIVFIILLSQSFAINNNMSTGDILKNILNHNSLYFIMLVYFISIRTEFGKKYFNYLNLFLIVLYFVMTITSLFTTFQSFSFTTILVLGVNLMLLIFMGHTFLRDTSLWKEFKLSKSPFNEISNDGYFYTIMVLAIMLLAVNLISTTSFDGAVLSLLECIYISLFGRYVYLYYEYLDNKNKDSNNIGNFDKYKDMVKETTKDIKEKVNNYVEDNNIDEKIDNVKKEVVSTTKDIKEKVNNYVEDNKIDEKFDNVKKDIVSTTEDIKDKVNYSKKKHHKKNKNNSNKGDE